MSDKTSDASALVIAKFDKALHDRSAFREIEERKRRRKMRNWDKTKKLIIEIWGGCIMLCILVLMLLLIVGLSQVLFFG